MNNKSIKELQNAIIKFRSDRDWEKEIRIKDIAIEISLEAAEVLEHFRWKTEEQMRAYLIKHRKDVEEELADVLFNVLHLAEKLNVDFDKVFFEKMKKNEKKYPIEKVKGENPHL